MAVRSRALLLTIQFANLTTTKFRRSNWGPHAEGPEALLAVFFNEFVKENKLELGDKVNEELYLWVEVVAISSLGARCSGHPGLC